MDQSSIFPELAMGNLSFAIPVKVGYARTDGNMPPTDRHENLTNQREQFILINDVDR
jgi:hypothetical protein